MYYDIQVGNCQINKQFYMREEVFLMTGNKPSRRKMQKVEKNEIYTLI